MCYFRAKIKGGGVGVLGACSTHARKEKKRNTIQWENLDTKDRVEDVGHERRPILKWILTTARGIVGWNKMTRDSVRECDSFRTS
jgi:hypothetical protein